VEARRFRCILPAAAPPDDTRLLQCIDKAPQQPSESSQHDSVMQYKLNALACF